MEKQRITLPLLVNTAADPPTVTPLWFPNLYIADSAAVIPLDPNSSLNHCLPHADGLPSFTTFNPVVCVCVVVVSPDLLPHQEQWMLERRKIISRDGREGQRTGWGKYSSSAFIHYRLHHFRLVVRTCNTSLFVSGQLVNRGR